MKQFNKLILIIILISLGSCNKFLDVIPDNVATIDNAFALRTTAEKYLFTCYSYLPLQGNQYDNPGFQAGDELWHYSATGRGPILIARGNQNVVDPFCNFWDGTQLTIKKGMPLWGGIRDCNIFLEKIGTVEEMKKTPDEVARWTAEVKFFKAYYHYWLLRMYGPIPLVRENLPISSSLEITQVKREPVDSCVNYIVQLLDEAAAILPVTIEAKANELGRITKPIALSIKAQVLTLAASPLFNGNPDYAEFKDHEGIHLFNSVYSRQKWEIAATACLEAIESCHAAGNQLYDFTTQEPAYVALNPVTKVKMSIRNSVTRKWNIEVVWANTLANGNMSSLQIDAQARFDDSNSASSTLLRELAPTLKMAEMFYTKNGVPINEDINWDYAARYNLRSATYDERFNIRPGYETASLHFDREPRFYASLGFDGGTWFGQGKFDDNDQYYVQMLQGKPNSRQGPGKYSITGYNPQKLVNFENIYPAGTSTAGYPLANVPFPIIRLADLYMLYAETLNEIDKRDESLVWINKIRARANILPVQEAWASYSTNPTKYMSQTGLRAIIHQERAIEFAFEGQRYWDLKRWKEAMQELNGPIRGWDIDQPLAVNFYRPKLLFNQSFRLRDYFWPIKEFDIIANKNLVQNPGW